MREGTMTGPARPSLCERCHVRVPIELVVGREGVALWVCIPCRQTGTIVRYRRGVRFRGWRRK
jgi:hypothetical protein